MQTKYRDGLLRRSSILATRQPLAVKAPTKVPMGISAFEGYIVTGE